MDVAEFDQFVDEYDADLNRALAASGEDKDYFARGRVSFLARRLQGLQETPESAMDYGCGIGGTTVLLREIARVRIVAGLDVSERSLERAEQQYGCDAIRFYPFQRYKPSGNLDLAYCNGVFHHIPVHERISAVQYVYNSLRPQGLFAFWENNPWNPGTRYCMSQCVFDRDAVTLSPPLAKRLLREGGFEILRTDFVFYFPRALKLLRFTEPALRQIPLGAQYQILCRKPAS